MKYFKDKRKINFVIIITLTSILSLGVFMQGCNSDFDFENTVEELDIPEEYNDVGKLHNEGLEYIFEEIKAQGIAYTNNPRLKNRPFLENKDEFVKQATLDFCNQHKKLSKHSDIFTQALKAVPSLKSSGVKGSSPMMQKLFDEITSVLSQEFKKNELSRLKIQLDVINQKAASTLSDEDAAVIYCTTSTGYNSYHYWIKNHKKWYFALNYPEILEQYNSKELNQLQLKNGNIRLKNGNEESEGWWNNVWDTAESWWDSASDGIKNWWDDGGKYIVATDAAGAGVGAMEGTVLAVGTAGIAWGAIPAGAVRQAVYFSAGATIVMYLTDN